MMANFTIDWTIQEVATLLFESESIPKWFKLPGNKSIEVEHQICPTLYSCFGMAKPDWLPISPRCGQSKVIVYLEPSFNGFMMIVNSHDEGKKEFFGRTLRTPPEGTVRI